MDKSLIVFPLWKIEERFKMLRALGQAWLELQSIPSYVERFADGREHFEADDTRLPVGEQNHDC